MNSFQTIVHTYHIQSKKKDTNQVNTRINHGRGRSIITISYQYQAMLRPSTIGVILFQDYIESVHH